MTDQPRLNHVQCVDTPSPTRMALHRMAYWEWGDAANPRVLVCAHGLSRQGRDFDTLARALADTYRVVSVDVAGRGRSDRLENPMNYIVPQYVADMVTLLARLNAETVDWVGTSMGGLIGLGVASLASSPGRPQDGALPSGDAKPNGGAGGSRSGSPLRRLVLNDIGPTIEAASLVRIGTYLGQAAHWCTVDEAADALWAISSSFGPHTREQWLALTAPQLIADGDGFKPHYDPAIAMPFRAATPETAKFGETLMWQAYDSLKLPTLLLRGAESDLLSRATAQAMTKRGPCARLVEFAGVGHAPMLVQPDQVQAVRDFLLSP